MTETETLLAELLEAGADEDALSEILDACWDWRVVVPGPGGVVLEAADGGAWRFVLQGLAGLRRRLLSWYRNPQRREDARVRRAERRARRKARRAGR